MLDADFDVVISKSIAQIQDEPNVVRPCCQAAFKRLDPNFSRSSTDLIASFYAPSTYLGEAEDNSTLSEQCIHFEALACWLKRRLPLMLLAFAAVIFAGLRMRSRRRGRAIRARAAG